VNKPINLHYLFLFMHTYFFYFFYFCAFYFFYFLGWAGPGPAQHNFFGQGPAQPIGAGLNPASPARSLAQASDPAGPKLTRGTRGVSPRVHAQCEGNLQCSQNKAKKNERKKNWLTWFARDDEDDSDAPPE
jgi:hypothetical protein